MKDSYVVVTTDRDRRGVFFGKLIEHDKDKCDCILSDASMVVYWSSETKGVVGLGSKGPADGSKITPPVKELYINGVTSVIKCNEKSIKEFKKYKWN